MDSVMCIDQDAASAVLPSACYVDVCALTLNLCGIGSSCS